VTCPGAHFERFASSKWPSALRPCEKLQLTYGSAVNHQKFAIQHLAFGNYRLNPRHSLCRGARLEPEAFNSQKLVKLPTDFFEIFFLGKPLTSSKTLLLS
jgi:hypothetical protein